MRGMEEKKRERRVSFDLVFDVVCLWNEGESQQSQNLLVKLGLVKLQRPRQNPNSQCLLVELDLLGPEQVARPELSKCPRSRARKTSIRS